MSDKFGGVWIECCLDPVARDDPVPVSAGRPDSQEIFERRQTTGLVSMLRVESDAADRSQLRLIEPQFSARLTQTLSDFNIGYKFVLTFRSQ